jgi:hypothetical protein
LNAEIAANPARMATLKDLLGDDLFSLQAHWHWFTLNEAPGELYFPPYTLGDRAVTQNAQQDKEQLEKVWLNAWRNLRDRALPRGTWRREFYDSVLWALRGRPRT